MSALNKVMLIGNLGADPELRYTQNQTPVATFSIATTESWTGHDGQKQEKTEWHRIVAWQKTAEICQKYLTKGKQVYVEGRLGTRSWEDKDGIKRYATEVTATQVLFLGNKGDGQHGNRPPPPSDEPGKGQQRQADPGTPDAGGTPNIDDIPF